jgi:hypothetical protein
MSAEMKQVLSGWARLFGPALAFYLAVVAVSVWASMTQMGALVRVPLIVAPILPGLLLLWLTIRSYRQSDEYIRLRILQAAALAAVIVAALSLIYAFLELLGLPHLSASWTTNIVWLVFVAQMLRLVATGR